MQPYLIFTLTATLASFGELAGHERRGSLTWPGRSAILGLLGAAIGLRRGDDFAALDALSLAVAIFEEGVPLRDYHTVQTVPSPAAKRPNSRPEALREAGPLRTNTTITLRDYRAGSFYGVAVWGSDLVVLKRALTCPQFTLYLGRKSCPLSAPPAPLIVDADTPESALSALRLPSWAGCRTSDRLILDAAFADAHVETAHDQPRDRALWHFSSRAIAIRPVLITAGAAP